MREELKWRMAEVRDIPGDSEFINKSSHITFAEEYEYLVESRNLPECIVRGILGQLYYAATEDHKAKQPQGNGKRLA